MKCRFRLEGEMMVLQVWREPDPPAPRRAPDYGEWRDAKIEDFSVCDFPNIRIAGIRP